MSHQCVRSLASASTCCGAMIGGSRALVRRGWPLALMRRQVCTISHSMLIGSRPPFGSWHQYGIRPRLLRITLLHMIEGR
jgi:hypothetical protein